MLILFDHGTPRGLARGLAGHTVVTAYTKGWDTLKNGDLLLTTDRRMQYQQNLKDRKIAIVVLTGTTKWSRVRLHFEPIIAAVNAAKPGSYAQIAMLDDLRTRPIAPNRIASALLSFANVASGSGSPLRRYFAAPTVKPCTQTPLPL